MEKVIREEGIYASPSGPRDILAPDTILESRGLFKKDFTPEIYQMIVDCMHCMGRQYLTTNDPEYIREIQTAQNKLNEFSDRTTPQGKAWADVLKRLRTAFNGFSGVRIFSK